MIIFVYLLSRPFQIGGKLIAWFPPIWNGLLNGGVSLPTMRKRLGHKNLQTTLRYAEQADATADAEVRAWRRLHDQHPSLGGRREGGSP